MSETPDIQDLPPVENEQQKKLSLETLSDEQLNALADAWQSSQGTETPMADLRATLTDTGLFDFASKYNTDNIELRSMATAAQHMLEHRQTGGRRAELDAILATTKGTVSFEKQRAQLADLLGPDARNMSNADVAHFIKAAQDELDALNAAQKSVDADTTPSDKKTAPDTASDLDHTTKDVEPTNRELAEQVADLIDGKLSVNVNDKVYYSKGETAGASWNTKGGNVGGQFATQNQIRDIAAHADQIRDGLAARNEPGQPVEEEALSGDDIDEAATMRRYEAHTHADEAPAEGGDVEEETPAVAPEVVTDPSLLDGDEIDEAATMRRYEAHTHPDEAPAEGGDFEAITTPPVAAVETPPDGDEIDQDAAMRRFEAHNHEGEAPAEGGDITEPVEAQPSPTPNLNVYSIDQTEDAKALARDAARAKWREELQTGGRFKRFIKNVWMGENGVAGPYMYRKYYHEMLEQIQREGDVLAHESNDRTARRGAQVATIERFGKGYLHEDAGEQVAELEEDSAYGMAVKDLIRRYAGGEFANEAAFMEERGRILEQLGQAGHQDLIGEGSVRIDNMFLIAEQVKAMTDHGDSIDRILEGMKVFSGEARSHVRTEAHLNMIDRVIERLDNNPVGGLVSPAMLGAAGAIALGVWSGARGSAATAVGMTVPGVMGGVFAGLRENKRLQDDRMLHAREMATGKEYDANARRRVDIEGARYETVPAQDLISQLNAAFEHEGAMTPEQVQQAYEMLAMIESRVKMSDQRKIDLISFSEATQVEVERQALDVARAQAKVQLAAQLANLPADFRANLGITDTDNVDAALNKYTDVVTSLESDISAKDKTFNSIRVRRIAVAAATGAATSFFIGLGAQELVAFANPSYEGLAEHLLNPNSAADATKQTVLEGWVNGQQGFNHAPTSYNTFPLGTHGNALELPAGYTAVPGANGSFSVEGANGSHVVDNLTLNKNGSLTPESLDALRQHNVSVNDMGRLVTEYGTKSKTVSVDGYNKLHAKDITHITRDFWNDNDTPSPKFDHNELGLSYGGEHGTGVGANGSIRMSVAGMTEGGSWHGSHHVSWEDAAEHGKLKLAITGSRGTQAEAYMVDIKPNGSISIPADSPAAKFFSVEHGQVKFHGGFIEAVETRGTSHGVTHVAPLATVSGDHSIHHIVEQVPTVSERYVPQLKLTPPEAMEIAGFAGPEVVVRRPLEKVAARRVEGPPSYSYGGEYGEWSGQLDHRSPRFENDPAAELQLGEELAWFASEIEQREGADYVAKIRDDIRKSPELQQLPSDIRALTTIPVAAANESENIYKTLSLYAQQDPDQLRRSAILLNVNWLDSAKQDPRKKTRIDKTLAEIERARKDFPMLSIAVMEREYDTKKVEASGGVIGYVASDLMNTALMALYERIDSGQIPSDADVAIIRQDSDMLGLSRHYLKHLEKSMDEHKEVDIFQGVIRSEVRMQDRYPGFGIVTNFSQAMSIANAGKNRPWTVGINAVVRAKTLAAVGGLGSLGYTGAGSDDVNIGYRVSAARRGEPAKQTGAGGYYGSGKAGVDAGEHRIVVPVPGMTVDSSADRLIPQYLLGRHYGAAWNSQDSEGTGFGDGPGGYRERTQDANIMQDQPRESVLGKGLYTRIEKNLSGEISHANEEAARKVLGLFFYGVPNAYVIEGDIGGGSAKFKLTAAGRRFIRQRITREVDGSVGATYGKRKMRQLYGHKNLGRPPQAPQSPLVSSTT